MGLRLFHIVSRFSLAVFFVKVVLSYAYFYTLQAFFCAKPKNLVQDFQKPSSANFAETQLFSKNPVLKMTKLSFSEIFYK